MTKVIFFDFDGVILDSMTVRTYGFQKIFEKYDKESVDKLVDYHLHNGGLSRFHKIKYFYNEILKKEISENSIEEYANAFTSIMKQELTNEKYLIRETVDFIKSNHMKYEMHIVSGSEHTELNYLCQAFGIEKYFKYISGSPTHKNILVKNILEDEGYDYKECILIGDSINDYEAAKKNNLEFYGYNNAELINLSKKYLYNYEFF